MEKFLEIFYKAIFGINIRYFILAGVTFVLFYVFLKNKMAHRKIQERFPEKSDYIRELLYSLLSMSIFATVITAVFTILVPYTQLYPNISDYGWGYYVFSIIIMMFIHDTYFYWLHRLMHHPFLYRQVHLIHHKSTNPSPWASYSFHPIEAILEAAIAVIIAFVIPCHFTAIISFFFFQIVYNVYGHLGYELFPKNSYKHPVLKWFNTSVSHNQHHQYFTGNYGLYFTFWDRMMGTMREDYEERFESVTTKEKIDKEL